MRRLPAALLSASALLGCSAQHDVFRDPVSDQRIVYGDGLHNENTDLLALDDRILLAFRGGESSQVGTGAAHISIYASFDGGASFSPQSEIDASALPEMRDIRDPKLVEFDGKLFLYAISRLPGAHYRDSYGQAWTVRAESTDQGVTWSDPVNTFSDQGTDSQYWGMWRFTKRSSSAGETLYALGYDDGDTETALLASDDGENWQKRAVVVNSYDEVPSEGELQFFGEDSETAVAIVRLDDQGVLENGQSAICTAQAPFDNWECGRRLEQRLDGPRWISPLIGGTRRNFVAARKHLPCTFKRTALYELRGDLSDSNAAIEVCELSQLTSAGDTAYTGFAELSDDHWLLSWYRMRCPARAIWRGSKALISRALFGSPMSISPRRAAMIAAKPQRIEPVSHELCRPVAGTQPRQLAISY